MSPSIVPIGLGTALESAESLPCPSSPSPGPTSSTRPLLLIRRADADFTVEIDADGHGRLVVGRIMRVARASGRTAFFWTITGPAAPEAQVGLAGEEDDLDGAKAAFRRAFDRLLYWVSMAKDGELPWHRGAERVSG